MVASFQSRVTAARVKLPQRVPDRLVDPHLALSFNVARNKPLEITQFQVVLPNLGTRVLARAKLDKPFDLSGWLGASGLTQFPWLRHVPSPQKPPQGVPPFSMRVSADVDSDRLDLGKMIEGVDSKGQLAFKMSLDRIDPSRIRLSGHVNARNFSARLPLGAKPLRVEKRAYEERRTVVIDKLTAAVPIDQDVLVKLDTVGNPYAPPNVFKVTLPNAKIRPLADSTTYAMLRPYTEQPGNVTLDGLTVIDRLVAKHATGSSPAKKETVRPKSEYRLRIGRTILDVKWADSTLDLRRVYMKLFGGDVFGRLQAQLSDTVPPDLTVETDLRMTEVDFGYLAKKRKPDASAKISALAGIKYRLADEDATARIVLTDLSLPTLDNLLARLDPHGLDPSVQQNRDLINSWMMKIANPSVDKVSAWIEFSKANLDIELGGPLAWILRAVLKQMKIRRLSVRQFLRPVGAALNKSLSRLPGAQTQEPPKDANEQKDHSARRRPGVWRVPDR